MLLYLVISGIVFCISSQIIKIIFNKILEGKKASLNEIFTDGNYPSSHTSFVIGISTLTWLNVLYCSNYETQQIYIWIAVVFTAFAAIVVRDALGVRYTVQRLCDAVLILIDKVEGIDDNQDKKLLDIASELRKKSGHRPHEVIGGAIWGLQMALFTSSIYYNNNIQLSLSVVLMCLFLFVSYRYKKRKARHK